MKAKLCEWKATGRGDNEHTPEEDELILLRMMIERSRERYFMSPTPVGRQNVCESV